MEESLTEELTGNTETQGHLFAKKTRKKRELSFFLRINIQEKSNGKDIILDLLRFRFFSSPPFFVPSVSSEVHTFYTLSAGMKRSPETKKAGGPGGERNPITTHFEFLGPHGSLLMYGRTDSLSAWLDNKLFFLSRFFLLPLTVYGLYLLCLPGDCARVQLYDISLLF
jgi:hypothetical protein